MDNCILDIVYEFDETNKVYLKKVLLCGILNCSPFVKEICYNYPCKKTATGSKNIRGAGSDNCSLVPLGNVNIRNNDSDLTNYLNQFNLIIVTDEVDVRFVEEYFHQSAQVVVKQKKSIISQCHGYAPIDA